MTASNYHWMQPVMTLLGLDPLELLAVAGACLLVALLVIQLIRGLAARRRRIDPWRFSRLLEHVHARRGPLFLRPIPRAWPSAARAQFLESVRERLRDCDIFRRDSSCPVIGMDAKDGNHG